MLCVLCLKTLLATNWEIMLFVLCVAAPDAKPATLHELKQRKTGIDKGSRFCMESNDMRKPPPLSYSNVAELRSRLLNATASSRCVIPAAHALVSERFSSTAVCPSVTSMPDFAIDVVEPNIAYCNELEVNDYPLPVAFTLI